MKRLDQLRAKLAARQNVPGYEKNCDAIRAEIARLEAVHGKTEGNETE